MISSYFNYIRPRRPWRLSRRRLLVFILIAVALVVIAVRYYAASQDKPSATSRVLPVVEAQTLEQITNEATISQPGLVEPANAAPVIARAGGRITAVRHYLGDTVKAGDVIVEIDGGREGNIARAQMTNLNQSVTLFDTSRQAALTAADIAVQLAQANLKLAQKVKPLTTEAAVIARRQADLAVHNTELTLNDARDAGIDQVVRAADIAFKNAGLAQDQATINRQLTNSQQAISLQQAQLNVRNIQAARASTDAQLASQRQQLVSQIKLAQEQFQLQQAISPLSGDLIQLNVKLGDYVSPGTVIGEINALAGAIVRLSVLTSIRNILVPGQSVELTASNNTVFPGTIANIASAPATATGLWQVDIIISSTPTPIHAGEVVTVNFSAGTTQQNTYLLPLRIVSIRQYGAVLFTVGDDQRVVTHPVEIISYSGNFAEIRADLPPTARVVVSGHRLLKAGDQVVLSGQ